MINPTEKFGLGDLAYWVFRPFVYIIDWIWTTDMKDCERCKERRSLWNTWLSVPRWAACLILLTFTAIVIWWKIT
jgi:hypothetical protein